MKSISIRQPWASLIACGRKTIETRTWTTDYRGDLLICASNSRVKLLRDYSVKIVNGMLISDMLLGQAIAVVELYDIKKMTMDDEFDACVPLYHNAHSWMIRNVRLIPPFKVKGRLGLYEIDYEL